MSRLDEQVTALWDLLVARPGIEEGPTRVEIAEALGCKSAYDWRIAAAIREFRLIWGNDDTVNLIGGRDSHGSYRYYITGTLDGDNGAKQWAVNRVQDAETRLETIGAVLASIERALDGRSKEGQRARILRRAVNRAEEDLAELDSWTGA
jgi:hypothetical protein